MPSSHGLVDPELRGPAVRSPHSVQETRRLQSPRRRDGVFQSLHQGRSAGLFSPRELTKTHLHLEGAWCYAKATRKRFQDINTDADGRLETHTQTGPQPTATYTQTHRHLDTDTLARRTHKYREEVP